MPRNSRPDIQVLEDRIVRLKSQLLEYADLKLYKVTKRRLNAVAEELSECIEIIHGITDVETNNISTSSMSAFEMYPGEEIQEFNCDSDLVDTALLDSYLSPSQSTLSPKEIVKSYSARISNCAETLGCSSGILQVNQFCQVMNSWYQSRFAPATRNPNFFFKANRIHEWVDLLMIAGGSALHNDTFPEFIASMNSWTAELNTSKDQAFPLPYSVMKLKESENSMCTEEAVLLESIIKPSIYSDDFYITEVHSIAKIVMNSGKLSQDDLALDAILKKCASKFVITSSFDLTKYQEV